MHPKKGPDSVTACTGVGPGSASDVAAKLRCFGKAAAEAFEQLGMERVARLGQRIVAPRPLLTDVNQAGATQIRQVARGRRLWNSKNGNEITHAQVTVLEEIQNPQSRPVRDRAEEAIDRES